MDFSKITINDVKDIEQLTCDSLFYGFKFNFDVLTFNCENFKKGFIYGDIDDNGVLITNCYFYKDRIFAINTTYRGNDEPIQVINKDILKEIIDLAYEENKNADYEHLQWL